MKDLSAITILKNVFQKQLTVPVQPDRIPVGAFAVLLVENVVSAEAKKQLITNPVEFSYEFKFHIICPR